MDKTRAYIILRKLDNTSSYIHCSTILGKLDKTSLYSL